MFWERSFRMLTAGLGLLLGLSAGSSARAQFVWPDAKDHRQAVTGTYTEDPFITKYRQEFFAVYQGDFARFEKAMKEVEAMVAKDPKDARATVWMGNGQMIRAGRELVFGAKEKSRELLRQSKASCDRAVALDPDNFNVYFMRAVTFYLMLQYWQDGDLPPGIAETIVADIEKGIKFIGPDRLPKVSTHVRGEIYGELGIAYLKLGKKAKAKECFEILEKVCPDTKYAARAAKELAKLQAG